ncbi:MAG: FAD-dependent tricarballylate dehydrogenase TcuA [Chloroflexi bacterium]|nr:FAD-dependent tricarballylate dehydrogenase TcuA [Chloroflexota bacterium]
MPVVKNPATDKYDVIVAGAGNAALSAALAARETGASVLVLEKAPVSARGGNSFFTGGLFRFPFGGIEDVEELIGELSDDERDLIDLPPYAEDNLYADLMRVSEGMADAELCTALVRNARPTLSWLRTYGVRWVLAYGRQSYKVDGRFKFWGGLPVECVGAGQGLVDALFDNAIELGVDIAYGTMADKLDLANDGGVRGVIVRGPEGTRKISCSAVILACGGFEANPEMRARYLGPGWDLATVRGTQFNTGDGLRMGIEAGAGVAGHFSGSHAVAWDASAPRFGDRKIGDLFQKHSYPLGLIVNKLGERFVDEGADFRNFTYAKYGKEILNQPGRIAFQVFDQKVVDMLRDEYRIKEVAKAEAGSIRELAEAFDIDPDVFERTVDSYNDAVQDSPYDPAILDGKGTVGIAPPKSNWALKLDKPPFVAFAVTCGITFTFGGLKINRHSQVIDTQDQPIRGLYAAGELAGGLWYENYPGGSGLTAGAVFGRIAGTHAGELLAESGTRGK